MGNVSDEKQGKNTEARQRKRAANQEAGDKAEQGKNTEAGQGKRAEIREGAKTGIWPWASHPFSSGSVN